MSVTPVERLSAGARLRAWITQNALALVGGLAVAVALMAIGLTTALMRSRRRETRPEA